MNISDIIERRRARTVFAAYVNATTKANGGCGSRVQLESDIATTARKGAVFTSPAEYSQLVATASCTPPIPPATVPNPPTNVVAVATGIRGQASISFTPPTNNGGSPITGYYAINQPGNSPVFSATSPITFNGLQDNTSYYFLVVATNAKGNSTPVVSNSITTPTLPDAPVITSVEPDNQTLRVLFTQGSDGGSAIYDYLYSTDGGTSYSSAMTTVSPIVITGLTNGQTYDIKIEAVNDVGTSDPSNTVSGTPAIPTPSGNIYTNPTTNTAVTTVSQSPFSGGGNSYSFSGTSYLTVQADNSWAFGTGDFTVEWFQYQTDSNSFPRIYAIGSYPSTSIGCSIEGGAFYAWCPGANFGVNVAPYKNAWVHFAIVRRSGTLYAFKNGVQIASIGNSSNITNNITTLYIGIEGSMGAGTQFGGYITNLRIVKGLAIYTGTFTVPTSALTLTAAANPYGGSNTVAIGADYTKLLLAP